MQTEMTPEIVLKLKALEKIRESQRKANKKYRQTHPEKFREYSRKYYETKRSKKLEGMKQPTSEESDSTKNNKP